VLSRRDVLTILPSLPLVGQGLLASEDAPSHKPIRLVSYNIKRGFGMDGRTDLNRTIESLRKLKPDLLSLQEVDKNCDRSGSQNQPALIAKALGLEPAFQKFMDFDGGEYGLAVFSKFPIIKMGSHHLPTGREPRFAQEIQVELDSKRVSFVGLHLDWTTPELRVPQATTLIRALTDRKHVILAGDFNAQPDSPTCKHFYLIRLYLRAENRARLDLPIRQAHDRDRLLRRSRAGQGQTNMLSD